MILLNIGGIEVDGHLDKYTVHEQWVELEIAFKNPVLMSGNACLMWRSLKFTVTQEKWEKHKEKWLT